MALAADDDRQASRSVRHAEALQLARPQLVPARGRAVELHEPRGRIPALGLVAPIACDVHDYGIVMDDALKIEDALLGAAARL